MQCKCDGEKGAPKKVTAFGCRNGGFAFCDGGMDDFHCRDGTVLTRLDLLRNKLDGYGGCICKDGYRPYCKSTGGPPKCPDGSDLDLSMGLPGEYYTHCKVFKEGDKPNPK